MKKKKVAIKIFQQTDEKSTLSEIQIKFCREIGIHSLISKHEHIQENMIKFYGGNFKDNKYFIVMEKANENLREYLNKNENKLTFSQKLQLSILISNSISQLHSINIVHRDIKSKNILVIIDKESNISIKLADFGISDKEVHLYKGNDLNKDKDYITTYPINEYILEDNRGGRELDFHSFSFVLIEIFLGKEELDKFLKFIKENEQLIIKMMNNIPKNTIILYDTEEKNTN